MISDKEWEDRFVTYGYILLKALEVIAENTSCLDVDDLATLARKARADFDSKVFNKPKEPIKVPAEVYCNECKFYRHKTIESIKERLHLTKSVDIKQCRFPSNIGTWLDSQEFRRSPADINENNNCVWFKAKSKMI